MPKPLRASPPDTTSFVEVRAPGTRGRRHFTVAEKQRILKAADACEHGELGALLRKEGIYHSHLGDWRRQLARAGTDGLQSQQRMRTSKATNADIQNSAESHKPKRCSPTSQRGVVLQTPSGCAAMLCP